MKDFWKPKKINFKPMNFNMKPIKVKPMFGISKPANFSNFGITKNPVPRKPNKNLSYPQAKRRYSGLSPFGDWDRDGRVNIFDCRPFDFFKHRVPEEHSARKVPSYTKPGATFYDVFKDAEEQLPRVFTDDWEDEYSEYLTDALLDRSELKSSPFKDVVGVYNIKVPKNPEQNKMIIDYIDKTLSEIYPDKVFVPIPGDPKHLTVIDYTKDPGNPRFRSVRKIDGKNSILSELESEINDIKKSHQSLSQRNTIMYLERTVKEIRNLTTQLLSHADWKVWITDYPVDILRKSSNQGWRSCTRLTPWEEYEERPDYLHPDDEWGRGCYELDPFSDIKNWNGIAYFYKGGRTPGKDSASGRVMLRWGTEGGKREIGIENRVYPFTRGTPGDRESKDESLGYFLILAVQDILQKKGYGTKVVSVDIGRAYSDIGGEGIVTYKPYEKREQKVEDIHKFKIKFAKGKVPRPFIPFMVKETDLEIETGLAGQKGLRPRDVYKYSFHPHKFVRQKIAQRKEVTEKDYPEIVERFVKDEPSVRKKLLSYREYDPQAGREVEKYKDFSEKTLKELFSDDDLAYSFASEAGFIPDNFLKQLLNHKNEVVRRALIRRYDFPKKFVKKMVNDESDEVIVSLITNHGDVLTKNDIKKLSGRSYIVRKALVKSQKIPLEILFEIAKDKDENIRISIAQRYPLNDELVLLLSKDSSPDVLYALLSNITGLTEIDSKTKQKMISNILPKAISNEYSNIINKITKKDYLSEKHIREILDYVIKNRDISILNSLCAKKSLPEKIRDEVFAIGVDMGDSYTLDLIRFNPTVSLDIREAIEKMGSGNV